MNLSGSRKLRQYLLLFDPRSRLPGSDFWHGDEGRLASLSVSSCPLTMLPGGHADSFLHLETTCGITTNVSMLAVI